MKILVFVIIILAIQALLIAIWVFEDAYISEKRFLLGNQNLTKTEIFNYRRWWRHYVANTKLWWKVPCLITMAFLWGYVIYIVVLSIKFLWRWLLSL